MNTLKPILGSYAKEDCQFLMQAIETEFVSVEEKEKRIQSGEAHYSEMINKENAPSKEYMALFNQMLGKYEVRLAKEIMSLASKMIIARPDYGMESKPIVVVSLARAGTPIGVLVKRAIEFFGLKAVHYSVSIIRDKGIDTKALDYLTDKYDAESIAFVDGWTAKGVITKELETSVALYNSANETKISDDLFVISDIGGSATYCATMDDYAIPSSILNSTISGLISRTICSDKTEGGFHGCVKYKHLEEHDISNWFVDKIAQNFDYEFANGNATYLCPTIRKEKTKQFVETLMAEQGIDHINMIKPGIAEATRILLRRVPDFIMLKNVKSDDVSHLIQMAKKANVKIIENDAMPFQACAVIKKVTD
ncbi:cysteine protease StiP family protein [Vibrio parahaemolyticus]|uniref:cysteine protease StiP family protein n=1 Tax=Vibrio parahaemolyticus TaxID=670 RepID=UPI0009977E73|nr:cysteine protease StiP family protein [Vibrio parahaemolyticus]EGR5853959.1 hypothetical protein [Vibrio parahaemolyticus]ELA8198559.1 cysteine protease StiP family protein [Vibrio parahaemolyticus]